VGLTRLTTNAWSANAMAAVSTPRSQICRAAKRRAAFPDPPSVVSLAKHCEQGPLGARLQKNTQGTGCLNCPARRPVHAAVLISDSHG
jgi:hypothetical protein